MHAALLPHTREHMTLNDHGPLSSLASQVRHAWVLSSELAPWCEPACKRPPTAAKTRGQLIDRDSGVAAAAAREQDRARDVAAPTRKRRVRFSDHVSIIGFSESYEDDQ